MKASSSYGCPTTSRPCRETPVRGSAGITLVELLVVIAIIGIPVALLLPAVPSLRNLGLRVTIEKSKVCQFLPMKVSLKTRLVNQSAIKGLNRDFSAHLI